MRSEGKEFIEGFMVAVYLIAVRREGKWLQAERAVLENQTGRAQLPVAGRVVFEKYLDIPTYRRLGRSISV